MRRPTLLCSAEPWGFGPASKLFAILQQLDPRPRIVFAGAGSALVFARLNRDFVDDVVELQTPYDVLALDRPFDAVLTVMDPWSALLGARHHVPVGYVDSLFWFWNWQDVDFSKLPTSAQEWVDADLNELREITSRPINWHDVVPMAYTWSTRVYAQRMADDAARVALYPHGLVHVVGAVIGQMPRGAGDGPPLVSVSGGISHLTSVEVATRYATVVRRLLSEAGLLNDAVVTGNPLLLDVFADGPWQRRELDLTRMHDAMASASMLLAPAGLTTALEAAAIRVPLIFLPEQHGGHGPNVDRLRADDADAYDDLLLRRWFTLQRTDPTGAIDELDIAYTTVLEDAALAAEIGRRLAQAVLALRDPDRRAERIEHQRANVLRIVGSFDGAAEIAESIGSLVRSESAYETGDLLGAAP